ncbi:AAA family ATPase [Chitinophaga sp. Mgbs1]|uniref:AAA family ATPase n=1 Tax=Chitinophaga solisilvae TaxID=1233460 RepID=A0A433WA89_9BACT|nr:AAA family ATPase [Chitinophaga solisilvae]
MMWQITDNTNWKHLEDTFEWVRVMQEVPQDVRHHAEGNVAVHTQMVLAALEQLPAYQALPPQEQAILWAAALLHDVEKYSTTAIHPDGSITAAGHARKGEMRVRQILYRDIPTPFAIREQIAALVKYHGLPLWIFEKPDPQRALITASLNADTRLLALLARADILGRICADQADLLYRLDCFEELCRENECWGQPRPFASAHARSHYLLHEHAAADYVPYGQPAAQVILMSGLPGAGKDTYIQRHYKQWPLISLDNIRREMKISPDDKSGNGIVIQAAKALAREHLRAGRSFVWNATNITRQLRAQLISLFTQYHAAVTIIYVEVPASILLQQNRQREEIVPHAVMQRLISKLEVPGREEGGEVVYIV